MDKVIYAEEDILNYLNSLARTNSSAVGIIIGQALKSAVYVVHMARTEKGDGSGEALQFDKVEDIKKNWIKTHALLAKEKLPGGLSILGIFICSSFNIFDCSDLEEKLSILLLSNQLKQYNFLEELNDDFKKYIFHYNPVNQKFACKVALGIKNFKPVVWKFQKNCTKWCQISSHFFIDCATVYKKSSSLKNVLMNYLSNIKNELDHSVIVIGEKVLNKDQTLASIITTSGKKNVINGSEIQLLEASIYMPLLESAMSQCKGQSKPDLYTSKIVMNGRIRSQAFISENGTVEEAIEAVKEDIYRSLVDRIGIHLDSLVQEIQEKSSEEETIHDPPRRISVSLQSSPLCFNAYVYPDETSHEITQLFKELLDIELMEKDVNQEYERYSDLSTFHNSTHKKSDSGHSDDLLRSSLPTGFLIAALSFAVILIAIAIALRMQKKSSPE